MLLVLACFPAVGKIDILSPHHCTAYAKRKETITLMTFLSFKLAKNLQANLVKLVQAASGALLQRMANTLKVV